MRNPLSLVRNEKQSVARYPRIVGKEGYATVNIGDGIEAVPTAAACVRILKDSAGGLTREVVENTPYGQPKPQHWGTVILNMPNPRYSGTQLWRWVFGEIWARGEAFLLIERNAAGEPVGLLPGRLASSGYTPQRYEFVRTLSSTPVWLSVPTSGSFNYGSTATVRTTMADVLHFTDESYDPFRGRARSPLECKVRNPVGMYKLIVGRYLALLVNGGHADRYMETEAEGYEDYLKAKENRDKGVQNATDLLPIPMGSKIHEAGRSAIEMQTEQMLSWLDPRICMAWGVPLFALGIERQGGRGQRNDLREQYQQFLRSGFQTQVQLVEEELNRKLFAGARNVRAHFRVEDLTIGTMEQRAVVVNVLVQRTGVITPNEGREIMGLPPLPGKDANTLRPPTGAPEPAQQKNGDGADDGDDGENGEEEDRATRNALRLALGKEWEDADLRDPSVVSSIKERLTTADRSLLH